MAVTDTLVINNHAAFIWSVADLLRADYKASEYGDIVLPLTILRRLDCLMEPVRKPMPAEHSQMTAVPEGVAPILERPTTVKYLWNSSPFSLVRLLDDPTHLPRNLRAYIAGFSAQVREILDQFDLDTQITRLERGHLLPRVLSKFAEIDLHVNVLSDVEMGYLYEELIRRFSELSSDAAGEHFTPRDVVELVITLLLEGEQPRLLSGRDGSVMVFDPVCGTGGMLTVAARRLSQISPSTRVELYGQELNRSTGAICMAELMMSGRDPADIAIGDSLCDDAHRGKKYDYIVANPPHGLNWQRQQEVVTAEYERDGFAGRFGAGLPRINDGSLLFLQHMISKMKRPEDGGSRLAIVLHGSPLIAGGAGSGESEIRRWIIEGDLLETVVALPDQILFNTGTSTYVWILTNRKEDERRGKVQLVDAREVFTKMRKSVGEKRKQISDSDLVTIVREYESARGRSRALAVDDLRSHASGVVRIEPWMFDLSVNTSTHVRLSEIATLVRPEPVNEALPLLHATTLESPSLVAAGLDRESEVGRRYAMCCGGDVVGSGRRWTVLRPDFGIAVTALEVVRPRAEGRVDAYLLALWLSSEECVRQLAGGTVPRIREDVMVPGSLRANSTMAAAAQELWEMRAEARRLLDHMLEDPFERDESDAPPEAKLSAQASGARAVRSLLQPLNDVVHRAELQYPYQIAKAARDYRLVTSIDRRLEAGLVLAESLIRTIGLFAASIQLVYDGSRRAETLAHFQGGITSGSWLSILRAAQQNGALETYPELESISFKKRGLGDALQNCVTVRNRRRHATGMPSPAERQEWLDELDPLLTESLDRSAWLGLYENLWLTSCEYTSQGFVIHGLRVNGSHPDWEPFTEGVADPVVPNRLYLRTPRTGLLDLTPFGSIAACSECKRDELYVLDRVGSDRGTSRSVRDHRVTFDIA